MASDLLPELEQAAVEPVPQEVGEQLRLAVLPLVERHADADADRTCCSLLSETCICGTTSHSAAPPPAWRRALRPSATRRGRTPGPGRRCSRAPCAGTPSLLPLAAIGRNLVAGVQLEEAVRAEHLAPHGERLEDREAVAEAALLLAGRQRHRGAGREDAAALVAGVERAAHAPARRRRARGSTRRRRRRAGSRTGPSPRTGRARRCGARRPARWSPPWRRAPVTPVVQTVSFSGNAFSVKNARGKFRSPRGHAGSVQKRPEVPDRRLDLLRRQRVAERRHVAIERADRSAARGHGNPVAERLHGVGRAVGEVGKVVAVRQRQREADDAAAASPCRRRAWQVAHAGAEDLLAGGVGRQARWRARSAASPGPERRAARSDSRRRAIPRSRAAPATARRKCRIWRRRRQTMRSGPATARHPQLANLANLTATCVRGEDGHQRPGRAAVTGRRPAGGHAERRAEDHVAEEVTILLEPGHRDVGGHA